ncbi:hypothetical protein [Agromyces sp. NPDC058110]|uniref:hypothetical protein n=1 Tax=Agromyces sp. NPDC058110 TaxID=3346345 RepID=UPI0036DD587A
MITPVREVVLGDGGAFTEDFRRGSGIGCTPVRIRVAASVLVTAAEHPDGGTAIGQFRATTTKDVK